jgi:hypothetical protein
MRVVAYLRESADPGEDRPAFAQQEEIRRYAAAHHLEVVAICQDVPRPGLPAGREGYRSLLGIVAAGHAEAILLPGVTTLAADLVVQEIMLWDLRARGARVLSTDPGDLEVLSPTPADATRRFVRDVLTRVAEHRAFLAAAPATSPPGADAGVVVHLVPSPADTAPADRSE